MARSERWDGSEVATWEKCEGIEMTRWEVAGFIRGWVQGSVQDFIFLFPMLTNEM